MDKKLLKLLAPGKPPKFFEYASTKGMSVNDLVGLGGGSIGAGESVSVNGKKAQGGTALKPGDSVQVAPKALHG